MVKTVLKRIVKMSDKNCFYKFFSKNGKIRSNAADT